MSHFDQTDRNKEEEDKVLYKHMRFALDNEHYKPINE